MLQIQVLGKGIIPRGLGLAPRKEPFKADLTLIQTILSSPCKFTVNMLHPVTGRFIEITNKNVKSMWEKYSNYVVSEEEKKDEENKDEKVNDSSPDAPEKEDKKDDEEIGVITTEEGSSDNEVKNDSKSDDIEVVSIPEEEKKDEENKDDDDELPVTEVKEEEVPKNSEKIEIKIPSQKNQAKANNKKK